MTEEAQRDRLSRDEMRAATRFLDDWRKAIMRDNDISHAAFRAAFALSTAVDWKTFEAFPAQATIAEEIGAAERTVRDAFALLEERVYLTSRRRANTSKIYRLAMSDRKKTAGPTECQNVGSTGKKRPVEPEKNGWSDRKKTAGPTGKKQPPNDTHLTTIKNNSHERHASGPSAARSGAPAASDPPAGSSPSLLETPQARARLTAHSPAGYEREDFPSLESMKRDHAEDREFHQWSGAARFDADDDAHGDGPRNGHSISDDLDVDHPF